MKLSKWHKIIAMLIIALATSMTADAEEQLTPGMILNRIEAMPREAAKAEMTKLLDATVQMRSKEYKQLTASLEEMLSEPTWDSHNEELFALLIEHAANASCLSDNERLRPKSLLDVVRKNAPGKVANDIDYETLDGTSHKLSDITTDYTLIYFNDPECLSCAKVKERLDTTTLLKSMVSDSTLTVVGIYPYDNVDEWKQEYFPSYIINGWDYEQKVDGEQTYDLMTIPMFYLLDRDKRVILKNEASLNRVLKVLGTLKGMENCNIEAKLDAIWIRNN
jgi:hypothetical protein